MLTPNHTTERKTFVSHLECSMSQKRYAADTLHGLSEMGKPLLVRYDLEHMAQAIKPEDLRSRAQDFWRYRELLPVRSAKHIPFLNEVMTPIGTIERTGAYYGWGTVLVKDEGRLPTGSFKARGLALAVAMGKELGVTRFAMPTNGNAGAALAAYSTKAGTQSYVFCPADTPEINVSEIAMLGAKVWKVNGLINDCGKIVAEGKESMRWFDTSTLKEPYRIEGKKTMGLELAEQLDWQLPDAIFYPTGGGTGLIGMAKAFDELEALGWIGSHRPRMIAVQAEGCQPIVRAFKKGVQHAELEVNAQTQASGIRVPVAIGDFLILDAVRRTDGYAIAVADEAMLAMRQQVAQRDGVMLGLEGAATVAAYQLSLEQGLISAQDRALCFNCGNGLKSPLPQVTRQLDHTQAIDFEALAQA